MRGTRWLLLVIIAAIVSGIVVTYRTQKQVLLAGSPAKPAPLPPGLNSSSEKYHWAETDTRKGSGRVTVEVWAEDFKELKDSPIVNLTGVTIKLPSKAGDTYNIAKSAAASLNKTDHQLYSEGAVEITLHLPMQGEPKKKPVVIRSSGVRVDSTTAKAETDQPCSFEFERGSGTATGAIYDPETHALLMKSDVKLDWRPAGPNSPPMKIEAGSLEYDEAGSRILLRPWGRLTRGTAVMEGEDVMISLQDDGEGNKSIRKVEAVKAHGTDEQPKRKLRYSADQLWVDMNEDGVVRAITAQTNARLTSSSDTTETNVQAYHVDMNFRPEGKESILASVATSGDSVVTATPIPAPGRQLAETHVLKSDKLDLAMRPDGREIERVQVNQPGSIEFVPNQPTQHHRLLKGDSMFIGYGAQNRLDVFRASNASTSTDPTAEEKKHNRGVTNTTSRELNAKFDPKTGHLATMEQSGDFTYKENDREARAAKATLDSGTNVIVLDTGARMWDATGSTAADRIRLDEQSGNFTAEGHVNSSRLPDKDPKKNSQMLSGDEPLQAQAARMDSSNRNRAIRYQGGVTMWQGANRIQGNTVDIDREKRTLVADGNVVTNLWEQPKEDDKKKTASPVLTVVHAPHMTYSDQDRLATYTGGVLLTRPDLQVKAKTIQAWLAEKSADSSLDHAFADGTVEIFQTSKKGSKTGTGEHAEFYSGEQKIFLKGGSPKVVEREPSGKIRKTTEGLELTYFANDDRLLVNGSPEQPGQSRIQRK